MLGPGPFDLLIIESDHNVKESHHSSCVSCKTSLWKEAFLPINAPQDGHEAALEGLTSADKDQVIFRKIIAS